jgi:hypothetical protein
VSVRDSIIRHGRFLSLNRVRSRLCKGWLSFTATVSPLFWWVWATIETKFSLVNRNYAEHGIISQNVILGP